MDLIGRTLDGKYWIDRQLGKGGMGAVYLATHIHTRRPVALKVIAPQFMTNREFVIRFQREAEAAGRLHHPNVVNITDFGVTQVDGWDTAYLVMEYLDGLSLAQYQKKTPRVPIHLVVDILDQVALAIDEAHRLGIVHRDLKPENIFLENDRRGGYNVKVLDFGIAKLHDSYLPEPSDLPTPLVDRSDLPTMGAATMAAETHAISVAEAETQVTPPPSESETQVTPPPRAPQPEDDGATRPIILTQAPRTTTYSDSTGFATTVGTVLGTPAFMSPEQCLGQHVDARSDIYSLGVIAYNMVVGDLPFRGDTAELTRLHVEVPPPSPSERQPDVPKPLSVVILSALAKKPDDRPQSARAFAAAMRINAEGEQKLFSESKLTQAASPASMFALWALCLLPAIGFTAASISFRGQVFQHWYLFVPLYLLLVHGAQRALIAGVAEFAFAGRRSATGKARLIDVLGVWVRRLPAVLGTEMLLLMQPHRWLDGAIAPVIVMAEGLTGQAAIRRAQALNAPFRRMSFALLVREFSPLIGSVVYMPASVAMAGMPVDFFWRFMTSNAYFTGQMLWGSLGMTSMFLQYPGAFAALYLRARASRAEPLDFSINQPSGAQAKAQAVPLVRPGTLLWIAAPLLAIGLLTFMAIRGPASLAIPPLIEAAEDGRLREVERQLGNKVPVDTKNSAGRTALMRAASAGHVAIVQRLLDAGANPQLADNYQSTALHSACWRGSREIVEILLARGVDVKRADDEGQTPLQIATMRGDVEIARLLVAKGANPDTQDMRHKSPRDYARDEGRTEILRLFDGAK
jgi:serine/threonine protein kinase